MKIMDNEVENLENAIATISNELEELRELIERELEEIKSQIRSTRD